MSVIHHICIQSNSYKKSLNFYTEILGFKLIKETPNFHGRDYNTWITLENFMIELQTGKEEGLSVYEKNSEGIVHFCLLVDDVEKEYNRLKNLGFKDFLAKNGCDIYQVYDSKLVKLQAPEGTIIEIRDKYEI